MTQVGGGRSALCVNQEQIVFKLGECSIGAEVNAPVKESLS